MVHGVVVQMTTEAVLPAGSADRPKAAASFFGLSRGKGHVDGRRGFVLVFDFGLGQCRTAIETPVHRLQALEEVALLVELAQCADFVGFGAEARVR